MRSKAEFDATIEKVRDPAKRIATFGAMLAKDSGLGSRLIIAGGSAITVYSHGQFTSEDVDIVGERSRIGPVLKRWGFRLERGEVGRPYWRRDDLGLLVDIIHRSESSGSGRAGVPRTFKTTEGPVRASAVEDLIVRRLVFWSRSGTSGLLTQATVLFAENQGEIDLDYLEGEVRYEGVEEAYRELRRRAG
jgi:hypothetical protein